MVFALFFYKFLLKGTIKVLLTELIGTIVEVSGNFRIFSLSSLVNRMFLSVKQVIPITNYQSLLHQFFKPLYQKVQFAVSV